MLEAHMNRVRASNNGQPGTITFEGEQVPIQRYLDFLAGQITPSGERQECNSSNAAAFTALSKKEQSDVLHGLNDVSGARRSNVTRRLHKSELDRKRWS